MSVTAEVPAGAGATREQAAARRSPFFDFALIGSIDLVELGWACLLGYLVVRFMGSFVNG